MKETNRQFCHERPTDRETSHGSILYLYELTFPVHSLSDTTGEIHRRKEHNMPGDVHGVTINMLCSAEVVIR